MRRLLSAFAGQYLGAAVGGMLTFFLALTAKWDRVEVVFFVVAPTIVLIATAVGALVGGRSKPPSEHRPTLRALRGLAGAAVGMLVASGSVGCCLLIAYFALGDSSTDFESISSPVFVSGAALGAVGGYLRAR